MKRRDFILRAAAGVGWVVFARHGWSKSEADGRSATISRLKVRGHVWRSDRREGLPGITVSNGFDFAVTDAAGAYAIEVDVAAYPFVFVNPPAGFRAAGAHYLRAPFAGGPEAAVDFELEADAARLTGRRLRFAHVSDSHSGVAALPHFASDTELLADYRAIVADSAPAFILNGGDITDAGRTEDFVACLAAGRATGVPVIHAYGNHDSDADRTDAGGKIELTNNLRFQSVIGPDQYAFDWGDYHFIVCGMYWPGMSFRQPRMSAWLSAALARQPPDKKIVILTHDKPREFPELTDTWAPTLPELRKHPGTILVLHGHHHTTCVFRREPITVVGVPTVCFGGIDTSPRGYALVTLDDGRVDVELRQLGRKPMSLRPRGTPALPGAAVRWDSQLPTNLHRAPPVVTAAHVLVSLGDNRPLTHAGVVALDRETGRELWTYHTASAVKNSAGVAGPEPGALASSVFAVEVTGRLHRIELATGRREWDVALPYHPDRYIYATPRVTTSGIYVTQHQGSYAFAPGDGKILWQTGAQWEENRSCVYQCPGIDETKLFFLTTTFMGLHALSAQQRSNGSILWMRRMDKLPPGYPEKFFQSHFPSPVVADDVVVASGVFDRLAVFDKESGETLWHEPVLAHDGPTSGVKPAWYYTLYEHAHGLVVHGNTIYATTSNGCAYGIDLRTGQRHWRFTTPRTPLLDFQPYHRGRGNILTAPAIWRDRLLLGGADGWLYVLSATDGRLLAEVDFGSPITAPPVVAGDDLFVNRFDGYCTCYRLQAAVA